MQACMLRRHHGPEETRLAQGPDPRAAAGIDVVMRKRWQRRIGPARERLGEQAMAVIEERPAQGLCEIHFRSPRYEILRLRGGPTFSSSPGGAGASRCRRVKDWRASRR